jgi:hypothetical protein
MGNRSRWRRPLHSYRSLIRQLSLYDGPPWAHLPWQFFADQGGGHSGPETWVWCSQCERAYEWQDAKYDRRARLWTCAFAPGCNGDAVVNAWLWPPRPDLPITPHHGAVYPLYPDNPSQGNRSQ